MASATVASPSSVIREHKIQTSRLALNVRETVSGPVAIFLHGITAAGAVWDPVIDRLAGRFRAIAADQRGHGLSDKPQSSYSADELSDDVIALVEALGSGPAIVVGHSLGARNAVVAATRRPDAIRSVIAVDFTPYIEDEVFASLESRVNGGDRDFASSEEVEDYLHNRYPLLPPDAVKRRAKHAYAARGNTLRPLADPTAMAATARGLRENLVPAFTAVKTPVLLIRGAASKLVSAVALEKTRTLRPDIPTLVVPDTDHYVPEEDPDTVASAVLDFAGKP
jgi:2-(acetamidomethylene)succinate hydrolase